MMFADWLREELRKKDISQADLSRKSGISEAHISRILSGNFQAKDKFCSAVAPVLGYPDETVFRAAGLLPPAPESSEKLSLVGHLFNRLPEHDQDEIIDIMQLKIDRSEMEERQKAELERARRRKPAGEVA